MASTDILSFITFPYFLCGGEGMSTESVASFSWSDCGNSIQPIKITSLDAISNATKTLYVTGRGKVAENITAPLEAKIDMQKKFFWGWTKLPCVDNIGSCTFQDVCQLITYKTGECPDEFKKNDIPCTCPIEQGQYAVKQFPIDLNILPEWVETGKYRIKIELSKGKEQMMCLIIYINL